MAAFGRIGAPKLVDARRDHLFYVLIGQSRTALVFDQPPTRGCSKGFRQIAELPLVAQILRETQQSPQRHIELGPSHPASVPLFAPSSRQHTREDAQRSKKNILFVC